MDKVIVKNENEEGNEDGIANPTFLSEEEVAAFEKKQSEKKDETDDSFSNQFSYLVYPSR